MSILLMTEVWKKAPYKRSDLLILLALADSANDDGVCWPSIETLGLKARINRRNTYAALTRLEADGWLTRQSREGRSTVYTVKIPKEDEPKTTHSEVESVSVRHTQASKVSPTTDVAHDRGVVQDTPGVSQATRGGVVHDTQNHKEPSDESSSSSSTSPGEGPPPFPGGGMRKARLSWYPSKEVAEQAQEIYPWATTVTLREITLRLITNCKRKGEAPSDTLWLAYCRTENKDREKAERDEEQARAEATTGRKRGWANEAD